MADNDKNKDVLTAGASSPPEQSGEFLARIASETSARKQFPANWFANIRLAPEGHEETKMLSEKTAVIHVFEQRSRTDLACMRWKYRSIGLPEPESVSGIGEKRFWFFGKKIADDSAPQPGKPKALLLGRGSDVDCLADLIAFAKKASYPVILAPQVVLYERRPAKAGAPSWWDALVGPGGRPKLIRKWWSLLKSRGRVVIATADPINVKEFCARSEVAGLPDLAAARMLLDTLRLVFREERRVIIGPHVPQRERMKDIVRRHPTLVKAVLEEAAAGKRAKWEIWRDVDRHLDDIIADYNVVYIRVWAKVLSWVWKRFFNGVVVDNIGLERTRRAVRKGPVIYLPCHKSHTDYLLVSYVLFTNDMTPPHIAAGKNLNFWPFGHIFRRSGAFFMRRSFRGDRIYSKVYEAYVRSLVREGFNVEFYIEGGRSRTGKLFLPKMGVLGMLIRAYEEGELPDLSFVPIAISYDRVPEEGELLGETQVSKKKEGFIKGAREFMKKNFGRIHVNFAAPLSLREYFAIRKIEPSTLDVEGRQALYRDFAFRVIHAINDVSVITPSSVMAAALLARQAPAVDEAVAVADAAALLNYLEASEARLAPTFRNPGAALAEALRQFKATKYLKEITLPNAKEEDAVLGIDPERRPGIEYYKNNALHALYPAAFVAASFIRTRTSGISKKEIAENYALLTRMFKYEFVYKANWPATGELEKALELFQKWGVIEPARAAPVSENDSYWRTTPSGKDVIELFNGVIENFFEAYLFAFDQILNIMETKEFTLDDYVNQLMRASLKAYHLGKIRRRESISAVTFRNTLSLMAHLGIVKHVEGDADSKPKWRSTPEARGVLDEYSARLKSIS